MSLSLMVSTVDRRVVWVSDSFAEYVGLPSAQLSGRSIFDLLDGGKNETWAELFSGPGSDERFERFGVYLVSGVESVDRFELRRVRYVDEGRKVMMSLRLAPTTAEWESNEAFVSDVRAAMLSGDIYVAYQPIVDMRSGQLKKLEALARWTHPDRGAIGPDVFIPWAERTGVIDELGEWVLARSCSEIVQMEAEGIDVDLSVNVSVVQLRRADVSQRFGDVMASARLAPERVWIEVTESVLLDADALLRLMAFRALGVRLVIDDFGTGHANFEYLTRLVVDALKIDTSFVAGLGTESRATAIVRSIVSLGRELGLEIVAEGIENESQRSQLLDLHCRLGQGWLFSRALPYDELVEMYAPGKVSSTSSALVDGSHGADESVRLSALRACRILDTDPEPAFDSLVHLASQLLSAPMAVISLVDAHRQWFKARVGTDLTEVARAPSLCSTAMAYPEAPLIVSDTSEDRRSAQNPLVMAIPHARAYAGMPIRSREGLLLGTFSVVDTRPRTFKPRELGQLTLLADQVSELLDSRRRTVELDDLYIGACHSGRSGRPVGDLLVTGAAVAPGNGALAQLTRIAGRRADGPRNNVDSLRFDGLILDLANRTMTVDGQHLDPPAKEFDLLAFLATRPGQVFTRAELLQHVWNSEPEWQGLATVTEHIHRLRAKIETGPNQPKFLRTVRGKGYSFERASLQVTAGDVAEYKSGTWVHVDYRFVAVDDGMVALLAAGTADDLIGREVDDFVASSSRLAVRAGREMRAAGFVPGPQLVTLRAVDGTERLCLISTDGGEFDGGPAVIGSAREIVDAPRLMRQMVSGVVAEVSDAVVVTDPGLRVLSWNPAATRLYGWSEQEVLGHTLQAVVGDDSVLHGNTPWDEVHLNGSWTGVLRQRARDGSMVTVVSSVNLLRDDRDITGIAVVNRPVPPGLEPAETAGDVATQLTSADPRFREGAEQARLQVLGSCRALDRAPDAAFDSLTRLAARLMGTPIAAVSLVDRDRQWFMSTVGLEMTGTRRDVAFSSLAIATPDEVFVVGDTALDERFVDNPFVIGSPFIRSYAAMPICSREGLPLGTLSVIDVAPREFTGQQISSLKLLALQAAALFDLRRRAGELDDLIGEQSTELPVEEQLSAALGELSVQLSAFLRTERIFASTADVSSVSAKHVSHIAPSSSLAASSNPNVA